MDFDEYVAARGQALLRFGYVLSGDAHLAEDLVQTALLKAHRSWRRVIVADEPDAYVRRMLLNSFLDHRRRRSALEIPVDPGRSGGQRAFSADHAEGVVGRSEMWLALAALPRKQRAVLVLRYYEDCSDSAIAMLLGCTQSTVRSNAARALNSLRSTWTHSGEETLERPIRDGTREVPAGDTVRGCHASTIRWRSRSAGARTPAAPPLGLGGRRRGRCCGRGSTWCRGVRFLADDQPQRTVNRDNDATDS